MTRVGFLNAGSKEWIAQVHYLKNLLYALSTLQERHVQPVVFFGLNADEEIVEMLAPYAEIIRTPLLDKGSLLRNCYRLLYRLSGHHTMLNWYLKSKGISVLFHSNINDGNTPFKIINWIPDFQYLHLPKMFSDEELKKRKQLDAKIIANSDAVVLSSHDALKDYQSFAPDQFHKARVLQFVSQPFAGQDAHECNAELLASRYGFSGKFFYLPNQFWKHKNHLVVFQAVKQLRDKGINDVLLLCSGHMRDDRNHNHMESLLRFVTDNALEKNICFLGLIPYSDVVGLMRNAVSVINPSFFEGWSSTVEEAKSIGKNLILSDIRVHREQSPAAVYFDPGDAVSLAAVMKERWRLDPGGPDMELETMARKNLAARTESFARGFQNIVRSGVKTS